MSKEKLLSAQTKAELIKTIGVLRRHETRLLRDIDRLNAKVDKLERASVDAEQASWPRPQPAEHVTQHGARTGRWAPSEHVTPLPANAYGPFPWEPKR